ncbi:glycosyl hydrolase family 65 protein [Sporichthya sp.]|uniref:glycoside hydrolase family 65 protein n=1 Tax=Sporichthya sp. TaxID=65475 RepID=UPI00181B2C8D|nr:glycosyl hydrolase family 65 protein [Sporichthya sp.]MBA3741852.1 glycoside hydrolase family 65 protein [Sporichthya sp.]
MIRQDAYPVDPWCVRETRLDLDLLAAAESLFALSNGHLGLRGNLDEGEPHGLPGTYLNSVHEQRRLPYAEAGYGYPESGQSVVNVPNGKLIRILVDDEPFDIRYGDLHSHTRTLDLRTGILTREAEWCAPSGAAIRLRSERLVSLTQRAIAAVRLSVEPVDRTVQVVLQSELVANEQLPPASEDPRAAADLEAPFVPEDLLRSEMAVTLVHSTKRSGLRVGSGIDHEVEGPDDLSTKVEAFPDLARITVTTELEPGESVCLTKYLAYGWSSRRTVPAVRDQVAAALTAARHHGWDALCAQQATALAEFWAGADVQVDGDEELQQAVRFALFQILQASARAERRPIAAKGLTGTGYDGHTFWDTEVFVLPMLTYTVPHAAADALRWRLDTLPMAQERAQVLGLRGAAFPWRTITGAECSAYWPAGTAAFHINSAIAMAADRQAWASGDEQFDREVAVPLLVETARLWVSLGHHDAKDGFRIDGVTGPDEYSAVADNNVYTNLTARQNLRAAVRACGHWPEQAAALNVGDDEIAAWSSAADLMTVPWDDQLGVHPQAEAFTRHAEFDFDGLGPDAYPLMLSVPYVQLYRTQVLKQADLVLAMHLCGDEFTPEQKRSNFEYYERRTVRDSSLSAATQAVLAAEVGHLDLALDYTAESALVDLRDLASNTANGLHLAAMAGTWIALVAGFGGLRDHGRSLRFAPQLPRGLTGLGFALVHQGARLQVAIADGEATYTLESGQVALTLAHHGEEFTLEPKTSASKPLPERRQLPPPEQPPGRAPTRRVGAAAPQCPVTENTAS